MKFIKPLYEKKPKGAPDFHHSDAPDAEGRFRDLGIKDLAAWLIKTRKKDVKKISGSLTQQVVFNRNDDPEYAEKMEKVRKEVYKQLDRQDLIDKMDEAVDKKGYDFYLNVGVEDYVHNIVDDPNMSKEEKLKALKDMTSGNDYYKATRDQKKGIKKAMKYVEKLDEAIGLPTFIVMALGAALAGRLALLPDEKLQKIADTTEKGVRNLVRELPYIGKKIKDREFDEEQAAEIQKFLNDELTDQEITDILMYNTDIQRALMRIADGKIGHKVYYEVIRKLGGAAEYGVAHKKFKALRKKLKDGEIKINAPIKKESINEARLDNKLKKMLDSEYEDDYELSKQPEKKDAFFKLLMKYAPTKKYGPLKKEVAKLFGFDNLEPGSNDGEMLEYFYMMVIDYLGLNAYESVSEAKGFAFPNSFEVKKTISYVSWGVDSDKLFKGTYVKDKILSDEAKGEGVYINKKAKAEITLDQDDFTNFERLGNIVESVVNEKKQLPKEISKHKDIPSWARYVAQQSDGEWTWYEDTPTMIKFRSGGGAWKQDGNQTYTGVKTDGKDWDKIPTYYYVKGGKISESVLNEEDSYNDYPAAAKKNAQMAIDWKEKYGRDEVPAGTPVGWARAHQLAKGEKISEDTVKRMSAFNRHRKNSSIAPEHKDTPWKDNGYVAWLIWGGDEGVDWAMEKSKEIDAVKEVKQMKYIKPLHEVKRSMISGTSGRTISSLEYRKYELKKDVEDAKIGDFINVTLPKGTIIYNLPGGVFADHFALKQRYASRTSRGPQYFDKSTFKGLQIIKKHDTLVAIEKNSKVLESVNEGYWSHYDYEKWTKENGKPKYPKWVKTTLKEIVKGGFMEEVYDAEHNYMVLWLASLENKRRSELYTYDKKGVKEFGKVGYAMYQRFYNDLTGYNMFFMQGAMYALEVSKQIQDRIANGEPVEPAYYMMKEYFNNFGMDTKRSRVFNAAYEKLEKWMKDNQIETL